MTKKRKIKKIAGLKIKIQSSIKNLGPLTFISGYYYYYRPLLNYLIIVESFSFESKYDEISLSFVIDKRNWHDIRNPKKKQNKNYKTISAFIHPKR